MTRTLALLTLLVAAPAALAQSPAVEARDASNALLFRVDTGAGVVATGTTDVGTIPATGAGNRMMWFPSRYAFRAGNVSLLSATYWDLSNIGYGSAAFGQNTLASGDRSFAAGLATTASGAESVALGNGSTASGARSFAFNGTASRTAAVAIGSGAQAANDDALAMGPSSIANGLGSITIGPSVASGAFAVAIGLQNKASANFSVAIGKNARANRQGSLILSDGCAGFSSDSVYATANNQFVARGCGGIRFYTSQNLSSGVVVAPGGSSWSSVSDRNLKENFAAVDGEALLARLQSVPVTTWNYKAQDGSIRHMGPMAQDFYAAFGVGEDSLRINTVDIDGVALAGVQALEARTRAQDARIAELEAELAALRGERSAPVQAALPVLGVLGLLGLVGIRLRRRPLAT